MLVVQVGIGFINKLAELAEAEGVRGHFHTTTFGEGGEDAFALCADLLAGGSITRISTSLRTALSRT